MLEDQVAYLLQRYLGNYVKGLSKEALKISVWKGDVELTNMQLKPEALNALKLPVKVKAGFLGSVKLKVPWSRLGQDPVLVHLDRIFLLAEPETQVEGYNEDAIQEAKKIRVREMEMKLLEKEQQLKSAMSQSWLGSLINTIIGNLKLSISNIHIRYEDLESNPGHPFAAGVTLEKLIAVTVDDDGKETFVTGGALERMQKSVELEQLALYLDSDISPWHLHKSWEDLLPSEWVQVFRFGTKKGEPADQLITKHTYALQPVTGNAKYIKFLSNEHANNNQPLQKAVVNLDDVTLCLSKRGYRDVLKLADNFAALNLRLKYAHYRPLVPVESNPSSWWKYAYRAVSDQMKKASGKLSWEQVLKYARLRKRYISLYAALLKSDTSRAIVDDNEEIDKLDHELDIELILQWRMIAHKFVEQSVESDLIWRKKKEKSSWWSFGWSKQPIKDETEPFHFTNEDWEQLNRIIGYKEGDDKQLIVTDKKKDALQTSLEVHMNHNASKLMDDSQEYLAALSCENLDCFIKLYPETKVIDVSLGSYHLSSPDGLLAESATPRESLVGSFCYKPFDVEVEWSMVAKASPCYVTYLKDTIDQIIKFFENNADVSQKIALETAAAVQMTIDEVKRTAQQQMQRALKDHCSFILDLDIAAPKITIPTDFQPDNAHTTKLLLDLGNLKIHTADDQEDRSVEELQMYMQFDVVLSDVSAFLVDGDYSWGQKSLRSSSASPYSDEGSFMPVIDKCGVILRIQQIRLEDPSYPSTRLAMRLPSLGFHFSPARYHRLMQVVKIFQGEEDNYSNTLCAWSQADLEGWSSILVWKGVGNREAIWQRRYLCLVGPFLYVLEGPNSKSYKQCMSLRGKQVYRVPPDSVNVENVLALGGAAKSNRKIVEDINATVIRFDTDQLRELWQKLLQAAINRASGSAPLTSLSKSSDVEESEGDQAAVSTFNLEKLFMTGILDELKICFYYNDQHGQNFMRVLLANESQLFEFRAIGGRVELLMRENDLFIGTLLKSLEIEDLVMNGSVANPHYLARSFIRCADECYSPNDAKIRNFDGEERTTSEGDDKFYEAPDKLIDSDSLLQSSPNLHSSSEYSPSSQNFLEPPSFNRIAGLLPVNTSQTKEELIELADTLDSFVKAQIVVLDQNSSLYDNTAKRVTVTLATLSFFCRRPTILAIMEFVNAINSEDETCESFSDSSSTMVKSGLSQEDVADGVHSVTAEEPVVKSLLGKGKTQVVFKLTLKMARAQILLMNENEAKLATLSQDNLLADIKVFPSSFCIRAALGNLRMSDNSLPSNHVYFWICDMRNPGGTSFVELLFSSFSADDEDYEGYEYGLSGQLSEVRIVYLNRFVQEIVSYFMGLVPQNSKDVVKLKDRVTESEKWFTTSEIEGSPAIKLDLSLRKPIILMPRQTDSLDSLKLDIVHITVQNTFHWFYGSKKDINAIHLETITILVEDINLNVGSGSELGESIIQDVKGISIIIKRSLRDLLHQIPSLEAAVKMEELNAILSSKEYQIITECTQANFSEMPNLAPSLNNSKESSFDTPEPVVVHGPEIHSSSPNHESWITTKVSFVIDLIELSLHSGATGDASLATVQVSGSWFLYKSNMLGDGFLSASLNGFTVIDNREGTEEEYRLAIGKSEDIANNSVPVYIDAGRWSMNHIDVEEDDKMKIASTMLILDAKFTQSSTFVSLSIQRPQLLVALDFLLAIIEFFVPTVGDILTSKDIKEPKHISDAMILEQSIYRQPSEEASLCPQRPLIVEDERYGHFIYDGQGGKLYLKDRQGSNLSAPSTESMIYIGNGKKLQFKNVTIMDGRYLDSCITLGTDSSYSVSEEDNVFFEELNEAWCRKFSAEGVNHPSPPDAAVKRSTEFIIELQAVRPELTFYNTSKDVGESESLVLCNKLLHAELDVFCRLVMKDDAMEISANALGLTMESNGIRILEPFDATLRYSNASGKTNIHFSVSDIFMNLSFSILRLFLAVEDDILAFMRMTSRKMTVLCTQFDKVGAIRDVQRNQVYVFWRPRAPPGFAVLGDYLTPTEKPPTKGVLAVNTNFARVKKPLSFKAVWPPATAGDGSEICIDTHGAFSGSISGNDDTTCSVWFPKAPQGYVALGCVVSHGSEQPSQSSVFCILASLVTSCSLRDCIAISSDNMYPSTLAFWRIANSVGTFLPAGPAFCLVGRPYELHHLMFGNLYSPKLYESSNVQGSSNSDALKSQRDVLIGSGRRFEAVASFQLVWWNQGSSSRKKLSIWRPIVPQGVVYFGDLAVQGYETPNTCTVMHDTGVEELFRSPIDFKLVGQVKKQKGMDSISFWMPQAPPGFVSLGCVACKSNPKQQDLSALKCIRSDMVSGDQFFEDSLWDTSNVKVGEPFSIWTVGNDLGTFIVRSGFKKPPRRFALKLADLNTPSSSDGVVIDAEIRTFSAALFDDYGGLMVPLFNIALSGVGFTLHGRSDYTNSTVSFSLTARSYNDKYESWEPVAEPVDGFFRYQYDLNSPGAASQLRLTSTRDLNLNVSVSNANMFLQAYASWSNLSHVHRSQKKREVFPSTLGGGSLAGVHHKKDYYIIPRNKLGQDIFIRASEIRGISNIIKMASGDMKPLKVPVLKNMLDSHTEGKLATKYRAMVTVIIAEAQFPASGAMSSHEYAVAIRISQDPRLPSDSLLHQQSARTRGSNSDNSTFGHETVNWREMFFFKVDSPDSYIIELIVTDMAKGDAIGFFSAPLKQMAESISENLNSSKFLKKLSWINLSPPQSMKINGEGSSKPCGKLKCSVLLPARSEFESQELTPVDRKKSGFIQISPTMEGPWTTVRLNYAAPAACWRLGNDVVASEVSVQDGHRYVDIRSLVSVRNETNFTLELHLKSRSSIGRTTTEDNGSGGLQIGSNKVEIDEFFETQKSDPSIGWVYCSAQSKKEESGGSPLHKGNVANKLPLGWEWIDDWHLDKASVNTGDGWIYAPDIGSLKWPESYDPIKSVNHARQRRWIRNKKQISAFFEQEISVGQLSSGESTPLPLSGLLQSRQYLMELRPIDMSDSAEYSWSSGREKLGNDGKAKEIAEVCVSSLVETDELFFCTQLSGSSSNGLHKLLFCVSIQPMEVGKDIRCNPIHDWSIVVKAPLSLVNFLPLVAEFTIFEERADGRFFACMRGILYPGKPVNVYNADITNPLYLSLLPQRGWLPVPGEAVLISHPHGLPSKTMSFRSSITGRIVQIILEQNHDKEHPLLARTIKVYAPYWFAVARCPPLTYKFIEVEGKYTKRISLPFHYEKNKSLNYEEITDEEIYDGYTIASALNFNILSLSVSISGEERFGPVKDLSSLGDMDGSLDINTYNSEGNCIKLFVSTKTCPYQSVPTKVICIRPYMTFTNRLGQDIFLKLSREDDPKVLHASDSRLFFPFKETDRQNTLQVRLEDTQWSFPVQIAKEDTLSLVLRTENASRKFVKMEIRGFEEGSRFIVVFRVGSKLGPIRLENRMSGRKVSVRQSGFGEDYWIQLEPLSTTNFSWEDPYGQMFIEAKVDRSSINVIHRFDLEKTGPYPMEEGMKLDIIEMGDVKVAKFMDEKTSSLRLNEEFRSLADVGSSVNAYGQVKVQNNAIPMELIVEIGVVGVSLIDHKPKELLYLCLERVFLSYSTGYDGGSTSRFKLILGHLQLDNQLPLTIMPVLLAPEQMSDSHHPVFKMTVTACSENPEGIQVYPYVYIRVTEKSWRLNIHEPIIWGLVDFYNNIWLDRLPQSSSVTQVDPEIRVNLIDISEIRLKLSLETAPAQRPHGVLGIWSPILSAVGNAFKIQVHLRRVMHKDRFMRKSSILSAILNRIWRDLIHNPLHLLFSVDVLGMASSTLASLSKGFAELSTDGQFLQLRSKQVRSRRITGVGDGIIQGTEALAQGVAFAVSGAVRKPVESARQSGLPGIAHGVGRAFVGFVVQPLSGALDLVSMTVEGVGVSFSKCLEVLNDKTYFHRIRNPRAIRADNILRNYCAREALGQMILYLGETSRHFGCTEIFKEPSKFAWSDHYEEHFLVPYQRIALVTNKRVMLLQCLDPEKMDKKPCKILWDVPWEDLMALELAKAGFSRPSHLILHLKNFKRAENFVRVIKCSVEEEAEHIAPQAVRICSVVQKMWKAYQSDQKCLILKVPSSQRYVHFSWEEADEKGSYTMKAAIIRSQDLSSSSSASDDRRFVKHSINFVKIWSSEPEITARCNLCRKQVMDNSDLCSIWRPVFPDGYIFIGDVARIGCHPPNCAAVYRYNARLFALPIGYDLVWRNCLDDYITPVSVWLPRAPEGFVSLGCVAVAGFNEPEPGLVYCVAESLAEETEFEEQKIWSAPSPYPWACHIYQTRSDALHFMALRLPKEESHWKPMRVLDQPLS